MKGRKRWEEHTGLVCGGMDTASGMKGIGKGKKKRKRKEGRKETNKQTHQRTLTHSRTTRVDKEGGGRRVEHKKERDSTQHKSHQRRMLFSFFFFSFSFSLAFAYLLPPRICIFTHLSSGRLVGRLVGWF